MKRLMFVAICAMAVMVSCKNKGQTAPADSKDSLEAVIDSIIEENDTTPLPMFLIGSDENMLKACTNVGSFRRCSVVMQPSTPTRS